MRGFEDLNQGPLNVENSTFHQSTTWPPPNQVILLGHTLLHCTHKICILALLSVSLCIGCNGVFSWGFFNRCCNRDLYGWRTDCFSIKRGKIKECKMSVVHLLPVTGFAVQLFLMCCILFQRSPSTPKRAYLWNIHCVPKQTSDASCPPSVCVMIEVFFLISVSPGPWVSA